VDLTLAQAAGSVLLVVSLMLATGLRLQVSDLLALRRRPGPLGWALVMNLVVLPALAWGMVVGLDLPPLVGLGVLLGAAAPGGPAAILYVTMAGVDLPLTVGLTLLLPAIAVISTPLTLSLVAELSAPIPVLPILTTLVGMQMVPLAAGMLVRRYRPALAARAAGPATTVANLTLAGLVVFLMVTKGHVLLSSSVVTWLAIAALAGLGLVLGYGPPGVDRSSARAGALVGASRNSSVAIMLASTFFLDPVVDATVLLYGLMNLLAPMAVAAVWRRRPSAPPSPPDHDGPG